ADALALVEELLNNRREVLGEEHPLTAMSFNNVAFNLNSQGKYGDAEPMHLKALEIWRKTLGDEAPNTAIAYANFAKNLDAQAKFAEAQHLLQKALEIRRKVLGEKH